MMSLMEIARGPVGERDVMVVESLVPHGKVWAPSATNTLCVKCPEPENNVFIKHICHTLAKSTCLPAANLMRTQSQS
eukprot:9397105-Karenia_brevis.AAC.1